MREHQGADFARQGLRVPEPKSSCRDAAAAVDEKAVRENADRQCARALIRRGRGRAGLSLGDSLRGLVGSATCPLLLGGTSAPILPVLQV